MPEETRLNDALTGRYEIEREIGAGGMATVYLARDVKHDRNVALKVLKPELGAVLGAERFLAEIRVTANLQHPNLLPLFDSGEANGLLFYVMPFVDGESLRARLDREKQLPVDEAVRIAVAIAGALDYAHARGVIHRDLKPENILLQAGQPVIADFGIALAVSNAGGARVTQTGLSLGTPQYMSPEQATGDRAIDARTDIYSLGAMTYEMLTGEPPHTGTSAQAIIAKLMTEDVRPVTVLRRAVPPHVDGAVRHALEKLAADRFASAGDFSAALTGARPFVMTGTHATTAAGRTSGTSTRARAAIAALAVIAAGSVGAALWMANRPVKVQPAARFELRLPDSVSLFTGGGTKLALSKDGTKIVFVGVRGTIRALYVRRIEDPVAQLVRGSEIRSGAGNVSPSFSSDGQWLLFEADQALMKIPVVGGTAQTLADTGSGQSWGDRGTIVYARQRVLWRVSPDSRNGTLLASPDTMHGIYGLVWPEVLPGAEYALVTINRARANLIVDSLRLGIVSLSTGKVADLAMPGTNPRYSAGHVLFGRSGGLVFAAPFSLRKRAFTGPPTLLVQDVWQGTGGATGFTVSENGFLAYHEGQQFIARDLMAVDRAGVSRRIPTTPLNILYPRVSPDGRRVIGSVLSTDGRTGVSLVDLTTGGQEILALPDSGKDGEWTRDGLSIAYFRTVGNGQELVARAPDRSRSDSVLRRTGTAPDTMKYSRFIPGAPRGYGILERFIGPTPTVYVVPMDTISAARRFTEGSAFNHSATISPDGRVVAWVSEETGVPQVYAQPIPGPGARVAVSVSGGTEPAWSHTGATLYYRGPNRMMSAEVIGSPLQVTHRDSLFVDTYRRTRRVSRMWDPIPGGKEFLMLSDLASTTTGVFVVVNWLQLKGVSGATAAAER